MEKISLNSLKYPAFIISPRYEIIEANTAAGILWMASGYIWNAIR